MRILSACPSCRLEGFSKECFQSGREVLLNRFSFMVLCVGVFQKYLYIHIHHIQIHTVDPWLYLLHYSVLMKAHLLSNVTTREGRWGVAWITTVLQSNYLDYSYLCKEHKHIHRFPLTQDNLWSIAAGPWSSHQHFTQSSTQSSMFVLNTKAPSSLSMRSRDGVWGF